MTLPDLAHSEARRRLLGLFFADESQEYHLRDLHRRIGMSLGATQHVVGQLEREGLLRRRKLGNLALFSLNRAHPLFREIESVVTKTTGIAPLLAQALARLTGVSLAFIYGSYVSVFSGSDSTWTGESDVDLLVVGEPDPRQVSRATRDVGEKTNRRFNYTVLRPAEILRMLARKDSFVEDVLSKPVLPLVGFAGGDASRPLRLNARRIARLLEKSK